MTFDGYARGDRGTGVRNHVLVVPSVICSHAVADRIAEALPYARSTPHDHGCAQLGADNDQTERTLVGVAANPNVAGAVVVGLGCEEVQSDEVAATLEERGVPVREVAIQDEGGTEACVEAGLAAARDLRREASAARTAADRSDLVVGVVSGDLAASTRETADPLVGRVVDDLVEAGATVLVAGAERVTAHPDAAREATAPAAGEDLEALLARHGDQPARATRVRADAAAVDYATATRAWGSTPVGAVVDYGDRPGLDAGVALVDAPSRFEEAATGLAAAGAQVVVHVTADGVPAGHPVVPVVKVSGDPATVAALPDDIDVDATAASPGDLHDVLVRVADGDPCAADAHGLASFAITRVGPSM